MNRLRSLSGVGSLLVLACSGCFVDDLLDVEVTDRVPAEAIEDPANTQLMVNSAIADFECAFTLYIVAAGLLGDELADGQQDLRLWDYDRRSIDSTGTPVYAVSTCDGNPGVYQTLQTARYSADTALRLLQSPGFAEVADRETLVARMAAYAGYSYLLLGEAMCSAAVDGGPLLQAPQMLDLAEQRFTLAIDTGSTTDSTNIVNLARVGRARTRMNLGRGLEALDDARQIPPGFRYEARYSDATERSSNRIWAMINRGGRFTVEEDFRGVHHMDVVDPRVPVRRTTRSTVNPRVPLWIQTKYQNQDSPIPIARYVEALLIIAEVLRDTTAVGIINQLHAAAGLPPFASSDPDDILRHVIEERRIEFFLESHHFHDKLRFNPLLEPDPLPDTPAPGTPFLNGGSYGATRCLPLPEVERLNNPNIP